MNINIQIKQFQQNLIQIIQESQLPVGIVYYILKNQLNEIDGLYKNTVEQILQQQYLKQQQQQQKQLQENETEETTEQEEQSIIEEVQD